MACRPWKVTPGRKEGTTVALILLCDFGGVLCLSVHWCSLIFLIGWVLKTNGLVELDLEGFMN